MTEPLGLVNPTWFNGAITEIVDGDTFKATLDLGPGTTANDRDLGFHVYVENRRIVMHADLRLYGCNAAEHGTPSGDAAKAFVSMVMPVGTEVKVGSYGPDKYGGRYDAAVVILKSLPPDAFSPPAEIDLATLLIAKQYAAAWDGTGVKPVPPWPRTVQ